MTDQHISTDPKGAVVLKMTVASASPEDLQPQWSDLRDMKVSADLTYAADGKPSRLTVTVSPLDDSDTPPKPETVCWALQQIWNELTARGFVAESMLSVIQNEATPSPMSVSVPA